MVQIVIQLFKIPPFDRQIFFFWEKRSLNSHRRVSGIILPIFTGESSDYKARLSGGIFVRGQNYPKKDGKPIPFFLARSNLKSTSSLIPFLTDRYIISLFGLTLSNTSLLLLFNSFLASRSSPSSLSVFGLR